MFHTIEFKKELVLDIQVAWNKPLEQATVRRGTRMKAQIKPHVTQTGDGFVEVADLFFEDGTATVSVPFAYFSFVE
jgi:hypothetical protein